MVAGALPYRTMVVVDCSGYGEHRSMRQSGPLVDDSLICRVCALGDNRLCALEETRTLHRLVSVPFCVQIFLFLHFLIRNDETYCRKRCDKDSVEDCP